MALDFALFVRGRDSIDKARYWSGSWEEFTALLKGAPVALGNPQLDHKERKTYAAQFIPAKFVDKPVSKGEDSVVSVSTFVLDVDKCSPQEYRDLKDFIEAEGLTYFLYSTYSHVLRAHEASVRGDEEEPPYSFRVLFPLSRPVRVSEWRLFWSNARLKFMRLADQTCKYAAKGYLAPCYPEELADHDRLSDWLFYEESAGKVLDVDSLLGAYTSDELVEHEDVSPRGFEVAGNELLEFIKKSKRRKKSADTIKSLVDAMDTTTPYATEGNRHKTLLAMSGILSNEYPNARLEDITVPFKPGIAALHAKGGPSFDEFQRMVRRDQEKKLRELAKKQIEKSLSEVRAPYTVKPITREEILSFITKTNCGFSPDKFPLIILHKETYYIFDGVEYKTTSKTELMPRVLGLHQQASDIGFDAYFKSDGEGPPRLKSAMHLVHDHGTIADRYEYQLEGHTYLREKDRTMLVSMITKPELTPERVPEVEEWLASFCRHESDVEKVQDWMSQVPNTDMPLCALILLGNSGTGKSQFANGLSRLWGSTRPTDMGVALGAFNMEMARCPLILADESFPKIDGRIPTDKIRSLITSGVHHVNPKGLPHSILHGYVRCVGAMNPDGFDFGFLFHSKQDTDAIARRFLVVHGKREDADAKRAEALFTKHHSTFIDQSGIARHCLWLAKERGRKDLRFGVSADSRLEILLRDEGCYAILSWIVNYLLAQKTKVTTLLRKPPAAFVHRGSVYVNLRNMNSEWEVHLLDKRKRDYTYRMMRNALDSASVDKVRVRLYGEDAQYFKINQELLLTHVESSDVEPLDRFELLLGMTYEMDFQLPVSFRLTDSDREKRDKCMQELSIDPSDPTAGKVLPFSKKMG